MRYKQSPVPTDVPGGGTALPLVEGAAPAPTSATVIFTILTLTSSCTSISATPYLFLVTHLFLVVCSFVLFDDCCIYVLITHESAENIRSPGAAALFDSVGVVIQTVLFCFVVFGSKFKGLASGLYK